MNRTPAGPHRPLPHRVVACLVLALAALVPTLAASGGVVAAAPGPGADEGLDWIGAQLTANGGSLPASFGPGSDWGITADAVLAHVAAGRGGDAPAQSATDELIANVDLFTTWDDLGPEYAGVRLAGQLGKVVLAALAQGRDVTSVGGVDLVAELRSLVQTSGPEPGRFSDRNPYSPDNSNGFGQALSMLALSYTDAGVPASAVTFLIDQQCPNGGFRLFYTSIDGCDDASNADTDATALALQALLAAPRTSASASATADAVSWLVSVQDPTSGAWTGSGPTATPNANSTGVIAQALRASGETAAADRGAEWIRQLQLTAAGTAGTPAATDVGAVAYDPAARTLALSEGITASTGDQWRRSTTQAVLALGLERYGAANDEPLPTATTTAPTSTTTTSPTSTTSPPTSTAPTSTAPTSTAPASTAPASTDPTTSAAPGADALAGNAFRTTTSPGRLAVTGTDAGALSAAGAVALLVGLMLLGAAATRRDRS